MGSALRASSRARRSCCAGSLRPCSGRFTGPSLGVCWIRRYAPSPTWRPCGSSARSVRALEPVALELRQEGEALHRPHTVDVDLAVQVIELVLEDTRVKALGRVA